MYFLLVGLAIGVIFGLPVGAVGAMTVQRTWAHGVRAGLATGLGASLADSIYAAVGASGLAALSNVLLAGRLWIHSIGGALILFIGLRLLGKQSQPAAATPQASMFASAFVIGITNPAAILTFLFAFSWLNLENALTLGEGLMLVAGVFCGTYLWWLGLTLATDRCRQHARRLSLARLNRFFGAVLTALGVAILAEALVA